MRNDDISVGSHWIYHQTHLIISTFSNFEIQTVVSMRLYQKNVRTNKIDSVVRRELTHAQTVYRINDYYH